MFKQVFIIVIIGLATYLLLELLNVSESVGYSLFWAAIIGVVLGTIIAFIDRSLRRQREQEKSKRR